MIKQQELSPYEHLYIACMERGHWEPFEQWEPTEEAEPTNCMPGSEEKIGVLAERARLGQPLFHSRDRIGDPERPSHSEHRRFPLLSRKDVMNIN